MTMTFEEVKKHLKQRFPFIMVDRVLELEPGRRIKTLKNVAGNEIQFLGHFADYAIMPGTLMIEAIGQSASILFSRTTGVGMKKGEFMALAAVNMLIFHFGAYRKVAQWDTAVPPTSARVAGALSIAFWVAVIFFGRWIGFTT